MDEARIASKVQQKAINLLNQLITELSIKKKNALFDQLRNRQLENAGDYKVLQQDVKDHPDRYHVLYLEHGDENRLKDIMKSHDIKYLEIEPSVLDYNGGGFIISDDDYITLRTKEAEHVKIQHRYSLEQLRENMLDINGQTAEERAESKHNVAETETKLIDPNHESRMLVVKTRNSEYLVEPSLHLIGKRDPSTGEVDFKWPSYTNISKLEVGKALNVKYADGTGIHTSQIQDISYSDKNYTLQLTLADKRGHTKYEINPAEHTIRETAFRSAEDLRKTGPQNTPFDEVHAPTEQFELDLNEPAFYNKEFAVRLTAEDPSYAVGVISGYVLSAEIIESENIEHDLSEDQTLDATSDEQNPEKDLEEEHEENRDEELDEEKEESSEELGDDDKQEKTDSEEEKDLEEESSEKEDKEQEESSEEEKDLEEPSEEEDKEQEEQEEQEESSEDEKEIEEEPTEEEHDSEEEKEEPEESGQDEEKELEEEENELAEDEDAQFLEDEESEEQESSKEEQELDESEPKSEEQELDEAKQDEAEPADTKEETPANEESEQPLGDKEPEDGKEDLSEEADDSAELNNNETESFENNESVEENKEQPQSESTDDIKQDGSEEVNDNKVEQNDNPPEESHKDEPEYHDDDEDKNSPHDESPEPPDEPNPPESPVNEDLGDGPNPPNPPFNENFGDGPNPPSPPSPPDNSLVNQNPPTPPGPGSNESFADNSFGSGNGGSDFSGSINDIIVSDDVLLDDRDGRSRDSFNNAVYQATMGDAVADAQQHMGREYAAQFVNSVAAGEAGLTGLMSMRDSLTSSLTKEDMSTLSSLMKAQGKLTGDADMAKGLDFTDARSMETSFKSLQKFTQNNKLVETRSIAGMSGHLAVDHRHEYGRNRYGSESLRVGGRYINKRGEFSTSYSYAEKNFNKLRGTANTGLKKGDPNLVTEAQVKSLYSKLTDRDGHLVQQFNQKFDSYQLGNKMKQGKAGTRAFSLNWRNNAQAQKALNESEAYQGMQKPKALYSQIEQFQKLRRTGLQALNERRELRLARQQTSITKRIAASKKAGNAKQADRYIRQAQRLKAQKLRAHESVIRNRDRLLRDDPATRLKKAVNKKILTKVNKTKVGHWTLKHTAVLRRKVVERFRQTLLGKMFGGFNTIRQIVMKFLMKILGKLLAFAGSFFLLFLKIELFMMLIGMVFALILPMFMGNDDLTQDPEWGDIEASIIGGCYNQLTLSEGEWAHRLKYELFELDKPYWIDELEGKYTVFLPDGTVDWDHFHMTTEEYITEIIETDYTKAKVSLIGRPSGIAKGPEPFPGAPEGSNTPQDPGAYKWIRLLDGGVEVQFRGIGGAPGQLSNTKEIISMATVVQAESQRVVDDAEEFSGTGKFDVSDDSPAWAKLGSLLIKTWLAVDNFFRSLQSGIKAGFLNLMRSNVTFNDWWKAQVAKERTRMYMLYAAPLFEYSHTEEYGLRMGIHPTKKTLEVYEEARGATSDGVEDNGYNWGEMCSGIEDQNISTYMPNDGTDYVGDHDGYGCKSFDEFAFKFDSEEDMYYDGVLCEQVKASWNVEGGDETDICVAPGSNGKRWLEVTKEFGHSDCWKYLSGGSGVYVGTEVCDAEYENAHFIDAVVGENDGYTEISSPDDGETYEVIVMQNPTPTGETDAEGNPVMQYDLYKYRWGHHCLAHHTGYYCGGHFTVILTGCIYHMTDAQKMYNHNVFEEKRADEEKIAEIDPELAANEDIYGSNGQLKEVYHVMYYNRDGEKDGKEYSKGDPFLVKYIEEDLGDEPIVREDEAIDACRDLFDVDASYPHSYGRVNFQKTWEYNVMFGWDYDLMNAAASKLEEDWKQVYGIDSNNTIGGREGGPGSSKMLATSLSPTEIKEILDNLDAMYADDPTWPARRQAIETALTYVGKIAYSQAKHGSALADGALNDCSGYVSQCWKDVLKKNYTTSSFYSSFPTQKWDSGIKPGDIILHYDGKIGDGVGDHALIYIGKDPKTGEDVSVDCTGSGTHYRNRGSSYYHNAFYIPMDKVAS